MIGGKVTEFQTGHKFPGGNIDPKGGKFGAIVDVLKNKNGFSDNRSFDHPEGQGVQKQFADGLWYHVIINYPKGTETGVLGAKPNPQAPSPRVTAHCHATNPEGVKHIIDRVINP
jgi:hypothetical protein